MKKFGYQELEDLMLLDESVYVAYNKITNKLYVVRMLGFSSFHILGYITMNQFIYGDFYKCYDLNNYEYFKVID